MNTCKICKYETDDFHFDDDICDDCFYHSSTKGRKLQEPDLNFHGYSYMDIFIYNNFIGRSMR